LVGALESPQKKETSRGRTNVGWDKGFHKKNLLWAKEMAKIGSLREKN